MLYNLYCVERIYSKTTCPYRKLLNLNRKMTRKQKFYSMLPGRSSCFVYFIFYVTNKFVGAGESENSVVRHMLEMVATKSAGDMKTQK